MTPIAILLTEGSETRFWEKVQKGEIGACWIWLGKSLPRRATANRPEAYGVFKSGNKSYLAHRVAYLLAYGRNPNQFVLHRCDNPTCCNPSHLYEGSHADNMRDRRLRGHIASHAGELHGQSKLTVTNVLRIRKLRKQGASTKYLASEFNVSKSLIVQILSGHLWKSALDVSSN